MDNKTHIKKLTIQGFRNFTDQSFDLTPNFNVFHGENGAGKTSILEAIYYLALGKSFRTHLYSRIINHDADHCLITTALTSADKDHFIGLERRKNGDRTLKLNKENQASIAPITKLIPLQLMSVDSYRYFSDGPKERRAFLDWGLFHVEQEFLSIWQQFNRTLKQRNAGLKEKYPKREIDTWNEAFVTLSNKLDMLRAQYVAEFQPIYNKIVSTLLPYDNIEIRYKRGWKKGACLSDILEEQFHRDSTYGSTQNGPHRSDLQLYVQGTPADDLLSQGQQKLAAYALHLAQGILFKEQTNRAPIYLVDDLPSELDPSRRARITEILAQLDAQVLITGITESDLSDVIQLADSSVFHVEQSSLNDVISP